MLVRSTPAQCRLCASSTTPRPSTTPGGADADAEGRPADGGAQLLSQADGETDRLLAAGAVERYLGACLDLAGQV